MLNELRLKYTVILRITQYIIIYACTWISTGLKSLRFTNIVELIYRVEICL